MYKEQYQVFYKFLGGGEAGVGVGTQSMQGVSLV